MVASPATSEASSRIAISRPPQSAARATPELSRRAANSGCSRSISATMPSVAANDIWKLGCTTASGATSITTIAATASVRKVIARRSTMTPISTTAVIKNERCVATSDARQQEIEGGGRKRRSGRPLLDRKAAVSAGNSASSARTAKNTAPATIAM